MSGKRMTRAAFAELRSEIEAREVERLVGNDEVRAWNRLATRLIPDVGLRERVQSAQLAHWRREEERKERAFQAWRDS